MIGGRPARTETGVSGTTTVARITRSGNIECPQLHRSWSLIVSASFGGKAYPHNSRKMQHAKLGTPSTRIENGRKMVSVQRNFAAMARTFHTVRKIFHSRMDHGETKNCHLASTCASSLPIAYTTQVVSVCWQFFKAACPALTLLRWPNAKPK